MKYSLLTFFVLLFAVSGFAQKQDKEAIKARVAEMVAEESFTFRAETVYPQGRPSRFLTEQYYMLTVND
ncbi:MAG TPA: hypothetical protein VFX73_11740, partial [Chitinophagaceae bacterium]|nr:hypothetical protein [Chitinophagaceae bacterium]